MKIKSADLLRKSPGTLPADLAAIMIYGPDHGAVSRAFRHACGLACDQLDDPFSATQLDAEQLQQDPVLLADALAGLPLFGTRRLVSLKGASDSQVPQLESYLTDPNPGAILIMAAGDLPSRSKLRKLCESADKVWAIACYADEARDLAQHIQQRFQQDNITHDDHVIAYMVDYLGADQAMSHSEMEKIALYAGQGGHLSLADIEECLGDSSDQGLEQLVEQAFSGQIGLLPAQITRLRHNHTAPIACLRAAQLHGLALYQLLAEKGQRSSKDIVDQARPPIFFKKKPIFQQHISLWEQPKLTRALEMLQESERLCKSTHYPDEEICYRSFLQLAMLAKR